jgi:hypothetical protein
MYARSDLNHLELCLRASALGTDPVFRHITPESAGRDSIGRMAISFAIDKATQNAKPGLEVGANTGLDVFGQWGRSAHLSFLLCGVWTSSCSYKTVDHGRSTLLRLAWSTFARPQKVDHIICRQLALIPRFLATDHPPVLESTASQRGRLPPTRANRIYELSSRHPRF